MIRGKKIIMLNPITKKKIKRFKSIKRGYYSLLGLIFLLLLCCVAELLVNSRALIVKYNGEYFSQLMEKCSRYRVWFRLLL